MTFHATLSSRSAALPLFLGATAAGFGLGLLALTASVPPHRVEPLPLPNPLEPVAVEPGTPDEALPLAAWAPVFGVPAPEPVFAPPPPEPLPEAEPVYDDPFVDIAEYRLQGLVVEADGGLALIESDDGVAVYRVGDFLPGGEELVEIVDDGVEVELDGEFFFIGFDDEDGLLDDMPDDMEDEDDLDPGDDLGTGRSLGPVGTVGR